MFTPSAKEQVVKVTDYERIANITPTQLGQIECPKCNGVINERSPEKRSYRTRREWDCPKCGRGWIQVAAWVRTVSDAHKDAERLTGPDYE